ncbi:hypothetical protein KC318_g22134, partial [Hortaea werneckii]
IQRPPNGDQAAPNGFLSPASAYPQGYGSSYWRNLSRSPSPLGLIPIHREWRAFVHKHEVPRKILHVSIGFLTLYLYYMGWQPTQIHPILLRALIPIFTLDVLRFRWPAFNRAYIRVVGAFMRESEAHDRRGDYERVVAQLVRHGGVDGGEVVRAVYPAGAEGEEFGGESGGVCGGRGDCGGILGIHCAHGKGERDE